MRIIRRTVTVTTDSSGDYTEVIGASNGLLLKISYVPDGTSPLDTGADLTITSNIAETIYSQDDIGTSAFNRLPRQLIADAADGSVSTTVYDYIPIEGPMTVTVANGGDTLGGVFHIYIGQ